MKTLTEKNNKKIAKIKNIIHESIKDDEVAKDLAPEVNIIEKNNKKRVKIENVIHEFEKGYEVAKDLTPAVTILGSARFKPHNKYYKKARELGFKLGEAGYNVITGGGGGIMEAGNRGAYECGKTKSVGFKILLANEKHLNPYTHIHFDFDYFYSRKYMLFNFADAIVVFPGGFGTLDELLEILMLLQTEKLNFVKIFLYCTTFWNPIFEAFTLSLLSNDVIHADDLKRFRLTDSIDYIVSHIDKK